MSKPTIVLFNGPANTGKSKVIEYMEENSGWTIEYAECKDHLHGLMYKLFNINSGNSDEYWEIYNTRELKNSPNEMFTIKVDCFLTMDRFLTALNSGKPYFGGNQRLSELQQLQTLGQPLVLTIREAMIYVSEVICKPLFGEDYFGKVRGQSLLDDWGFTEEHDLVSPIIYVDSSAAFVEELNPLIEELGQEHILLLRIRRDGYEFGAGDSRKYIPDGVIDNTADIHNNGTEQEYFDKVVTEIEKFLVAE